MPKDATRNIDRYKIRGGELNEFDFHQNQEQFAEQQKPTTTGLIPGTPPEVKAERLRALAKKAASAATKKTSRKPTQAAPVKAAGAKKPASKKAAKKK